MGAARGIERRQVALGELLKGLAEVPPAVLSNHPMDLEEARPTEHAARSRGAGSARALGRELHVIDLDDDDSDSGKPSTLMVSGIALDSRNLQPGELFLAVRGSHGHGLDYADDAIARGAAAIAWEPGGDNASAQAAALSQRSTIPLIPVVSLRQRVSVIADRYFDHPSAQMRVIGVTGTDGKTSICHFVAQALQPERCGVMGTLGVGFLGELDETGLTTPDPIRVQATLAEMRAQGADYAVMEASSHALDQGRVSGVRYSVAVLTNLGRDHLDYHGDLEHYKAAKAKLFRQAMPGSAVLNLDDPFGRELVEASPPQVTVRAYGRGKQVASHRHYVRIVDIESRRSGSRVTLESSEGKAEFTTALLGEFNVYNLMAALEVLRALGLTLAQALDRLSQVEGVPGRMQRFGDDPLVVVDYAHTPLALERVLSNLKPLTPGQLCCVFGCGGERDRGKRPEMGAVAERLADRIILTSDNPRGEPPLTIIEEIRAGMSNPAHAEQISDRAEAITRAVSRAAPGDLVLIAGKGHEQFQQIGTERLPFNDGDWVRQALAAR